MLINKDIEMTNTLKYDQRHGSPYDRGSADAYYGRASTPHYYVGATSRSERVVTLTEQELEAYNAGYDDQVKSGDFKDWG